MQRWGALLLLAGMAVPAGSALAQPAAGQGAHAASTPLQRWEMVSADGQRHYRLTMSVPAGPAPAKGWPVIYVLDGNAFTGTMTEAVRLEGFLARYEPAIVVGVGYDTDLPIDIVSRNFDYTPPTGPAPEFDDRNPTRRAGGADVFAAFLHDQLMPAVAARAAVDSGRRMLFGHSYGGLFATWSYLARPGLFTDIVAASPSLWYKRFYLPSLVEAKRPPSQGRLLIVVGENEQNPEPRELAMLGPERAAALAALKQVDSARALAAALAKQGAQAEAVVMPGETHASVGPSAISRAVRFFLHAAPAPAMPPKPNDQSPKKGSK
jgi:uncharacterized protein